MKIPKRKIRLMEKRNHKNEPFFSHFLEISRNRIFHWEWANRREKNESSLSIFLYPSGFLKKCHNSNDFQSILDKKIAPGSSRRDLSN